MIWNKLIKYVIKNNNLVTSTDSLARESLIVKRGTKPNLTKCIRNTVHSDVRWIYFFF